MKRVSVGIILRNGLVLACQRRRTARYPLKWEFPGGKIEQDENPREALTRELYEELKIHAVPEDELLTQTWDYREDCPDEDGSFQVSYFIIRSFEGRLENRAFEGIRWVTPEELSQMDVLDGNRTAINLLVMRQKADGSPLDHA
jgi:8-oxo-dGTP diphosphatase